MWRSRSGTDSRPRWNRSRCDDSDTSFGMGDNLDAAFELMSVDESHSPSRSRGSGRPRRFRGRNRHGRSYHNHSNTETVVPIDSRYGPNLQARVEAVVYSQTRNKSNVVDVAEEVVSETEECVCLRPAKNYICDSCGNKMLNTRLKTTCPVHPLVIMVMDLDCCSKCGCDIRYLESCSEDEAE